MENSSTDSVVYSEKDPAVFFAKIKNFFNRKIVKIILLSIIILVIAISAGLFVSQKYVENKKTEDSYQQAKQKKINLETIKFGETGMVGLYGEVKKIQANEIILQTKDGLKTIKSVEDTTYSVVPFVLGEKKETTNLKTGIKITFSEIKIDDLLDVVGTEEAEDIITAKVIMIYKIP